MITVKELIEALQAIDNKELPIELVINIYDKQYPIYGYLRKTVWDNIATVSPTNNEIRLNCYLKAPLHDSDSYYTIREKKLK